MTTQLIAMHGWAGDSRSWQPWLDAAASTDTATATAAREWQWSLPDRGYGPLDARSVDWDPQAQRRVFIGHSLGPHLLPAALLEQADAVVLLASFGQFLPDGRQGRQLRTALAGMAAALAGTDAEAMLRAFLSEAAAPQPFSALTSTILDAPLNAAGRQRLLADLALLESRRHLPEALTASLPCLIVEAGHDRIVGPEARRQLRQERPHAALLEYPDAGHCLLHTPVVADVIAWIGSL